MTTIPELRHVDDDDREEDPSVELERLNVEIERITADLADRNVDPPDRTDVVLEVLVDALCATEASRLVFDLAVARRTRVRLADLEADHAAPRNRAERRRAERARR